MMTASHISHNVSNSENPTVILTAEGMNDLGIELVYGDKIRLFPARLSQPFQTTQLMEAIVRTMEDAIKTHFCLTDVMLDHETITSISGDTHHPVTQIFIREGELEPETCTKLAALGWAFVETVTGKNHPDIFSESALTPSLIKIMSSHASDFTAMFGSKKIQTGFVVQSPSFPDANILVDGKYKSPTTDTKPIPVEGVARPDGLSISKNNVSLIIDGNAIRFHITDMQQVYRSAEALISGHQVIYTGCRLSSQGKRDAYRLDTLVIDPNNDQLLC